MLGMQPVVLLWLQAWHRSLLSWWRWAEGNMNRQRRQAEPAMLEIVAHRDHHERALANAVISFRRWRNTSPSLQRLKNWL